MSSITKYLLSFSKCKYFKICELYEDSSYTCTHGGGDYCGKFRDFQFGNHAGKKEAHPYFSRSRLCILIFFGFLSNSLYTLQFIRSAKSNFRTYFNHIASFPETKLGDDN